MIPNVARSAFIVKSARGFFVDLPTRGRVSYAFFTGPPVPATATDLPPTENVEKRRRPGKGWGVPSALLAAFVATDPRMIDLDGVSKRFGETHAVDDLTLRVEAGAGSGRRRRAFRRSASKRRRGRSCEGQ